MSAFWRNGTDSPTHNTETPRRSVRYGDALWLVTCPAAPSDPTHPGGGRRRTREHVLTNFKKDSSSLLGGYLTIDPRGYPLQLTVERPPPEIDFATMCAETQRWGARCGDAGEREGAHTMTFYRGVASVNGFLADSS